MEKGSLNVVNHQYIIAYIRGEINVLPNTMGTTLPTPMVTCENMLNQRTISKFAEPWTAVCNIQYLKYVECSALNCV